MSYEVWETYKDKLKLSDLQKEVQPFFSAIDNFHCQNEHRISLSVGDLANLMLSTTLKDKEYVLGVLEQVEKLEVSKETTSILIKSILSNKRLKEISLAAYDVTEGRLELSKIQEMLHSFLEMDEQAEETDEVEFVTDDLEVLVNDAVKQHGLRWRLSTLNRMLGSLRKGDFGFLFARPETGKTTFLASEATYMAEQLKESDGPVIWFN